MLLPGKGAWKTENKVSPSQSCLDEFDDVQSSTLEEHLYPRENIQFNLTGNAN